jgi:hypothetical protein
LSFARVPQGKERKMAEIALRKPATETMTTYGGAFGTGILLGWVAKTRPAWATGMTLMAGAGGAIASLVSRGFWADFAEGIGSAAMGALGASMPTMLAGGGSAAKTPTIQAGVKQLPAPTNVVAEAISRQVRSAVEI